MSSFGVSQTRFFQFRFWYSLQVKKRYDSSNLLKIQSFGGLKFHSNFWSFDKPGEHVHGFTSSRRMEENPKKKIRVLAAFDKFKDCITAEEAGIAVRDSLNKLLRERTDCEILSLSDGGMTQIFRRCFQIIEWTVICFENDVYDRFAKLFSF